MGEVRQSLDWAYASNLENLMRGPDAQALWIHGHYHRAYDTQIGATRLIANTRGYCGLGEVTGWREDLVIDIEPKPKMEMKL